MGFWESLMFRRWPKPELPASLTLDLETARLGKIALGDTSQVMAESLGAPASYWKMRNGFWLYPQLGLGLETEAERISAIVLVLAHPEYSMLLPVQGQFRPFPGLVRFKHGTERPSQLQERTLTEALGAPVWSDRDPEEVVLRFRHGKADVEAELTPEGALKQLALFPADEPEQG